MAMVMAMATVIGGAMFGDNLSMISDTTIAAVKTQNTKMKDKFKVNFLIVLPGAILTMIILGILTRGNAADLAVEYPFELVIILPYIAVLVAALSGAHVLIVLVGGTIFAGMVGLLDGSYRLSSLLEAVVAEGVMSMKDLAIVSNSNRWYSGVNSA